MTVEQLLNELGVTVDPAKSGVLKTWNDKLSALESDAQTKLADAQKQLQDAQQLQRVIDESIRTSGLTEANIAQLQANNAALTAALAARDAALEEIKKAGFTGISIPDLPKVNQGPLPKDPVKQLEETIMNGIGIMGQTMNEMNRYQRVFGEAVPEDPATIADRAIKSRLSVRDYMEQTYKVSAKEQEKAAAASQKQMDDYAAKKLEEWKAAHPVTNGHPELGPGVPSNYPNIPKPSDSQGVKEMAGKSPMEKIRMARDRVTKEVQTRMSAA
jgi:hypothetical protein